MKNEKPKRRISPNSLANLRPGEFKRGPNKITASFREAIKQAFEDIGGAQALAKWARENQTEFYKIAARLIPVEVQAKVQHSGSVITDAELEFIARGGRSAGLTFEANGEEVTH